MVRGNSRRFRVENRLILIFNDMVNENNKAAGCLYPAALFCLYAEGGKCVSHIDYETNDEWAFFINSKGRRQFNKQCKRCKYDCKQSFRAEIVRCDKFRDKQKRGQSKINIGGGS
jgi:hypothetical protein